MAETVDLQTMHKIRKRKGITPRRGIPLYSRYPLLSVVRRVLQRIQESVPVSPLIEHYAQGTKRKRKRKIEATQSFAVYYHCQYRFTVIIMKTILFGIILRKESSGDGQIFRDFSQKQLAVC